MSEQPSPQPTEPEVDEPACDEAAFDEPQLDELLAEEPDADEPGESYDVHATPSGVRGAVEAVLMIVEEPVTPAQLAVAIAVPEAEVIQAIAELLTAYERDGRGFVLREINGAWRVYSHPAYAPVVERFVIDGQQAKLTQASLETLAVVAYRQPVSRARVSAVRGVSVDGVIRTLATRGLIAEVGHDQESGAILYGTTSYFLQRMGLSSLEELPALAPFLPTADILDEIAEQGRG